MARQWITNLWVNASTSFVDLRYTHISACSWHIVCRCVWCPKLLLRKMCIFTGVDIIIDVNSGPWKEGGPGGGDYYTTSPSPICSPFSPGLPLTLPHSTTFTLYTAPPYHWSLPCRGCRGGRGAHRVIPAVTPSLCCARELNTQTCLSRSTTAGAQDA